MNDRPVASNPAELCAGIQAMIANGRLTVLDIPEDYLWLTTSLETLQRKRQPRSIALQPCRSPASTDRSSDLPIRGSDYAKLKVLLRRAARNSLGGEMSGWLDRYRRNGWGDVRFASEWFQLIPPTHRSNWLDILRTAGFSQEDVDKAIQLAAHDLVSEAAESR